MRATVSVLPPGGNGTRKRTGRFGQLASPGTVCAEAAPAATAEASSMTAMRIMGPPLAPTDLFPLPRLRGRVGRGLSPLARLAERAPSRRASLVDLPRKRER